MCSNDTPCQLVNEYHGYIEQITQILSDSGLTGAALLVEIDGHEPFCVTGVAADKPIRHIDLMIQALRDKRNKLVAMVN